MRRAVTVSLCVLAVSGAFAAGWGIKASKLALPDRPQRREGTAQAPAVDVEAARVRRIDLSLTAEATGYLQAWRRVEVHAEIPGRVIRRAVEEGSRVAAGAPLLELDDRDRRLDLKDAEASWLKAQAGYVVDYLGDGEVLGSTGSKAANTAPTDSVSYAERLHQEGLISEKQLEELKRGGDASQPVAAPRRADVRAAQKGLVQAEQQVERCRLALERTRVKAPFTGRVADLNAEVGQQISPGEALLTLLEDDRLKVDVDVLEADLVWLRPGAPAQVRIPSLGAATRPGTVVTVSPRIKTETGTGRVTIAIANPEDRLLTGLFASVRLETRKLPRQIVVPARAVLIRQGRELVFRIENGRALWTYVKVGARAGDQVAITEGLKEGDLVAVGGHFALAHESPVRPNVVDSREPAAGAGEETWSPSSGL